MLTKQEFVEIIDCLREAGMAIYHGGIVIKLLDIIMESDGMVEWWVHETYYGQHNTVINDNGVDIDLDTAEKLYDYLMA